MDVLGKSKDYDAMGNFLSGRASTIKDRLDVEKANYDVLAAQKDHIEKELETADGERAEILKK
jgi:F0F1-type ATP synthase membrane subunit b/b'